MAASLDTGGDRDGDLPRNREDERREGRSDGQYGGRGYEQVGQDQQGGWRGPGEMPGYRDAEQRGPQGFLQPTGGGQVPSEMRDWEREVEDAPRPVEPGEGGASGDSSETLTDAARRSPTRRPR